MIFCLSKKKNTFYLEKKGQVRQLLRLCVLDVPVLVVRPRLLLPLAALDGRGSRQLPRAPPRIPAVHNGVALPAGFVVDVDGVAAVVGLTAITAAVPSALVARR